MRRPALLLIAVPLLLAFAHLRARAALAVTYPPGWNLVSGPEGSHLVGATGLMYTLQPGDDDYETFPVEAALTGGFGYWAYFPNGGTLDATFGVESYAASLTDATWVMLGNPSSRATATFSGATAALIFVPEVGYVSVTSVPVGLGAWVFGAGDVLVSTPPGATPPAVPLAVQAVVIANETTVSYTAPGTLVLQVDVTRNGLPAKGATVSGTIQNTTTAIVTPFGPDTLFDASGETVRLATPVLPNGTRLLVHVDVTVDGLTATADTSFLVTH